MVSYHPPPITLIAGDIVAISLLVEDEFKLILKSYSKAGYDDISPPPPILSLLAVIFWKFTFVTVPSRS